MAVDRVAEERGRADKILALNRSGKDRLPLAGRSDKTALAYRARLSGPQARGWARSLRRTRLARLPPSRHALYRSLRIPDLRKGDDSPLSALFHRAVPGACHSRRLQTQRLRRCAPNGTFQTRLRQCVDASFSHSSEICRDVHVAPLQPDTRNTGTIYDAVRLARC